MGLEFMTRRSRVTGSMDGANQTYPLPPACFSLNYTRAQQITVGLPSTCFCKYNVRHSPLACLHIIYGGFCKEDHMTHGLNIYSLSFYRKGWPTPELCYEPFEEKEHLTDFHIPLSFCSASILQVRHMGLLGQLMNPNCQTSSGSHMCMCIRSILGICSKCVVPDSTSLI